QEIRVVGHKVGRAGLCGNQLVARAVQLPAFRVTNNQHAVGAVKGRAVFITFLHVRRPDALLEDELLLLARFALDWILEDGALRVRKLLVVVEEVLAAEARDGTRMDRDAESPAGDVDIMDAVVPDVA